MMNALQNKYIVQRLKIIHLGGILVMIVLFLLLLTLERFTNLHTFAAQFVLILMAIVFALSHTSLLLSGSSHMPLAPLFFLFLLNILTSVLVWATGSIESPFSILYIIFILITAQLYHYRNGVIQTLLAFLGFVFVYTATSYQLLPVISILPDPRFTVIYHRTAVVFLYGILYATLFLFTLFSSSTARVLLFRPKNHSEIESTYQEKIINAMPIGVMILDREMFILSSNPTAQLEYPINADSNKLGDYLSLPKIDPVHLLYGLARSGAERQLTWKLDDGEIRPVTITAQLQKGQKGKYDTFILFLRS